jgi:hypothetical protein
MKWLKGRADNWNLREGEVEVDGVVGKPVAPIKTICGASCSLPGLPPGRFLDRHQARAWRKSLEAKQLEFPSQDASLMKRS